MCVAVIVMLFIYLCVCVIWVVDCKCLKFVSIEIYFFYKVSLLK